KHAASVHPEPGSNSPLKNTNRTHQHHPGKKDSSRCTSDQGQKNPPTHRGRPESKSTKQKFGINKLGTLLSSQTTETIRVIQPGTKFPAFPRRCVYSLFHFNSLCQFREFTRNKPNKQNKHPHQTSPPPHTQQTGTRTTDQKK
ncbi:hypothetical protein KIH31_09200, partial [Paenarthrobacter sp. DKR-5]|uniref:hypothetical protein n=1 Tax=Paenarthrobacter sp. DKR-5 TaxID=2835535 RepID=UPI001BDCB1C0